ncbi:MAG: aminopeptidase [Bdellovibrionales bacterium RIFOXYD1_FULL_53_11]|nr:MAG: aminopeptidase [Bdellovibrionales bacterium RIFOXYD1_FULL_53_11]
MANEIKNPRAADYGIKIGRFRAGRNNALTDVSGVRVGHSTVVFGSGKLNPGKGPARTGVTVILPARGDVWKEKVQAGSFVLNGNGEAAGLMWLKEAGIIETPIALTNTLSVGTVQKGLVEWILKEHPKIGISDDTVTPLVFECDDSTLSDIRGMHVKEKHVFEAIQNASGGPVEEGCVGAGTGMMTYEFKGGIGTASRIVPLKGRRYTVGVLLNANHGRRHTLRIGGIPVGQLITDLKPKEYQDGSIVIVLATDAPMDSRQLSRLCKRAMLGLARTGAVASHGSGDVAIAFSTANRIAHYPKAPEYKLRHLSDFWCNELFEAVADATEEAVLNSLFAARTVIGRDGNTVYSIPHYRLKDLLSGSERLAQW